MLLCSSNTSSNLNDWIGQWSVRVSKNSIYHPPTNNIAIAALEQQMYLALAIQFLGLVKKII